MLKNPIPQVTNQLQYRAIGIICLLYTSDAADEEDSSALPTNPFELVEMIRRQNSMNDATNPSDAIDDALKSFNSLEEK